MTVNKVCIDSVCYLYSNNV